MRHIDSIYTHILRVGFIVLNQAVESGDSDWLHAEIEMLHNIPSLIGERNPERHRYYWNEERPQYIAWLTAHGSNEARSRMKTYYEPLWDELEKLHKNGVE